MVKRMLFFTIFVFVLAKAYTQQKQLFNNEWEFAKDTDTVFSDKLVKRNTAVKWEKISLPHTVHLEPIEKKTQQWQGICYYRRFFTVPVASKGKQVAIQLDAAMQEATVYLNGEHILNHQGGYLPFYIDVSEKIKFGQENSLVVRLDNRDNSLIPPGKPIQTLDFNYYSGLYRNAWLIVKDKLCISDPVASHLTAGGGVLVHYENVTGHSANMIVQTDIQNGYENDKNIQVSITVKDKSGKIVAQSTSKKETAPANGYKRFTHNFLITAPALWSPETPDLYQASIAVLQNGKVIDREVVKTGIKEIHLQNGTLYLNGRRTKIRGTNRHQEYPYVGYAVADNAQYRDAWKIKEAGFNFVRSSHYPQSPAFLDACDELGIMVMDAIPGWQYAGTDTVFLKNSFQDTRDMIHRDRNHPSVILWEASLNESDMQVSYMEKAHAIVHEELPFAGIYSAGWKDTVYDVFLPARQHSKAPDYWKKYNKAMPLLVAEYGDWEYYAQNAGFNQTAFQDLKPEERTSRQLRGNGEKRLLQQALNYQEAHNDNLYGQDMGDANWLMFDYNRGYADDIESSGIMDITRLPKFAFYFYQSQVDPVLINATPFNTPMLFIANYWQTGSDTLVKVFSNCEEVELFLNGRSLGKQKPDTDRYSTNLKHPPFTFHLPACTPGTLSAVGYIVNKKMAVQARKTPGTKSKIRLRVDYSGKPLQSGQNDVVFVYADIVDDNGTVLYNASDKISFTVSGAAELVGENPRAAEAGTATILLKAANKAGPIKVLATAKGLATAGKIIQVK